MRSFNVCSTILVHGSSSSAHRRAENVQRSGHGGHEAQIVPPGGAKRLHDVGLKCRGSQNPFCCQIDDNFQKMHSPHHDDLSFFSQCHATTKTNTPHVVNWRTKIQFALAIVC